MLSRSVRHGIPSAVVDGNDVLAVYRAVSEAAELARGGDGPTLIECKTVRWERHSAFSAGRYDDPEERQRWRKTDPIPRFRQSLLQSGATEQQLAGKEASAKTVIQEAVDFAIASPSPTEESLRQNVYAE